MAALCLDPADDVRLEVGQEVSKSRWSARFAGVVYFAVNFQLLHRKLHVKL